VKAKQRKLNILKKIIPNFDAITSKVAEQLSYHFTEKAFLN
jgi:hypothetical protein